MGKKGRSLRDGPVSPGELSAQGKQAQGPHFGLQESSIWPRKQPPITVNTAASLYCALIKHLVSNKHRAREWGGETTQMIHPPLKELPV